MTAGHRALLAVALLVVVAGVVGAAVHSASPRDTAARVRHGAAPASHGPTPRPAPGPSSASLQAGLLLPVNLGGSYGVRDDEASSFLDSAPCLAGLGGSATQSGRAVRGLFGSDSGGMPVIVEVVVSFPGAEAPAVYRSVVSELQVCPVFRFDLEGIAATTALSESALPAPLGDATALFEGRFEWEGGAHSFQIAVVLDGQLVIGMVWADSIPPGPAVMGDLPSTVNAAIGKLA